MNEFGDQIIFSQLLERHHRIQIPMIQRDYAQGRSTETEVREEFLSALQGALSLPSDDKSLPLNLDFIYGSVEGDEETRFLPLDGQQRLTTLFLLHWYLAWKDGFHDKFKEIFCPQGASLFSYRVRPSSKEFFDELITFYPDSPPEAITSLKAEIANQSWYFRYWRLDPTIQSSLTMLESIHEHFKKSEGFFARLVDVEQPAITFQLLNLENFGLSDDLYIKMNARGKPLTPFETFKARYEQALEELYGIEVRSIGDQSFPVSEYFARRMDTQWADFFWTCRDKKTHLYDEAVMNLFRAVALVSRDPESESYTDDILSLRKKQLKSSYHLFHDNGWLDRRFSETLFMLMEEWIKAGAEFVTLLPDSRYFDEHALFMKVVKDPTSIGYMELVQFVGYVIFMRENADDVNTLEFQEWMRIVCNLSVNTSYERPADMQRSIAGLLKLAPHSADVLVYFATTDKPTTGFSLQQIAEEKLKAELIKIDGSWRTLFDRAEAHGYFKGQIEFLLDFCGAVEKRSTSGGVDWGTDVHESLREKFEDYLKKAETMFSANGLAYIKECRWERALLSLGDYTLSSGRNKSFLVNSSTEQTSWKRLLRGSEPKIRKIVHELWNRLTEDDALSEQLDTIIGSATGLELWRQSFVNTPKAIEYCKSRVFRFNSKDEVYLLKKTQMNGAHVELFTFCLYHNSLKKLASDIGLRTSIYVSYEEVNITDIKPYILIIYKYGKYLFNFKIEYVSGGYIIYITLGQLDGIPDIKSLLCDSSGFLEMDSLLLKESSSANIKSDLTNLATKLITTT